MFANPLPMEVGSLPSPAAKVAHPAAGISLVAGARLPLAFIGLGLVAFAVANAVLALRPQILLLPHVHPGVVALAHLWLPGFLLSVSMGAIYQLMPVVLGTALRLPLTAAWAHFGAHAVGVALLASGFALGKFEVVALGGCVVTAGVGVLLVGTWRTFLASSRRDAIGWSFPLAVSWLAATVLFGIVLALNRRNPFLPLSVMDLLRAHAHVGLGGFFLTLLQGATFQLVPMFTMADLRRPRWVRAGLALAQAGLLVLTPGLACGEPPAAILGASLLAAGVGCSGVALVATFRSRRRRVLDAGLKAFALGAALLGTASVTGVVLAIVRLPDEMTLTTAAAYGVALIAGALGFMIPGMLCKIIPFLVWMKVYGPRAGRQPVPQATTLGSRGLEHAWIAAHAIALVVVLAAVFTKSPDLAASGAALLALSGLIFLSNVTRILRHLLRPETPVTATPQATAIKA